MSAVPQHGATSHHTSAGSRICDEAREAQLIKRQIRSEFEYLPGLKLTFAQARRLFGLDPDCCARVLASLVSDGILTLTAEGAYVRSAAGTRLKSA